MSAPKNWAVVGPSGMRALVHFREGASRSDLEILYPRCVCEPIDPPSRNSDRAAPVQNRQLSKSARAEPVVYGDDDVKSESSCRTSPKPDKPREADDGDES
jgi:hypothetical protein